MRPRPLGGALPEEDIVGGVRLGGILRGAGGLVGDVEACFEGYCKEGRVGWDS